MISFFVLVIVYFAFSWGLPWNKLPSDISFSYVFDLLFALGVSFFYRLPWKFKWKFTKQAWKAIGEVVGVAILAITCIWYLEIETPFRLVHNLEWHLLFFAPILEELVFRQTFQRVLIASVGGKYVACTFYARILPGRVQGTFSRRHSRSDSEKSNLQQLSGLEQTRKVHRPGPLDEKEKEGETFLNWSW